MCKNTVIKFNITVCKTNEVINCDGEQKSFVKLVALNATFNIALSIFKKTHEEHKNPDMEALR